MRRLSNKHLLASICMQCRPCVRCTADSVVNLLQAEQKLWLQTDPSDMMNDIIFNVRKVHSEVLLSAASIYFTS